MSLYIVLRVANNKRQLVGMVIIYQCLQVLIDLIILLKISSTDNKTIINMRSESVSLPEKAGSSVYSVFLSLNSRRSDDVVVM